MFRLLNTSSGGLELWGGGQAAGRELLAIGSAGSQGAVDRLQGQPRAQELGQSLPAGCWLGCLAGKNPLPSRSACQPARGLTLLILDRTDTFPASILILLPDRVFPMENWFLCNNKTTPNVAAQPLGPSLREESVALHTCTCEFASHWPPGRLYRGGLDQRSLSFHVFLPGRWSAETPNPHCTGEGEGSSSVGFLCLWMKLSLC